MTEAQACRSRATARMLDKGFAAHCRSVGRVSGLASEHCKLTADNSFADSHTDPNNSQPCRSSRSRSRSRSRWRFPSWSQPGAPALHTKKGEETRAHRNMPQVREVGVWSYVSSLSAQKLPDFQADVKLLDGLQTNKSGTCQYFLQQMPVFVLRLRAWVHAPTATL